jgi:hypothetical protein
VGSTAAIITAAGTLLAAVVACAALVVSQGWLGESVFGLDTQPPGDAPNRIEVSGDKQFGPEELRLGEMGAVDFDTTVPERSEFYGGDLVLWSDGTIEGRTGAYIWEGSGVPSASDCATYLSTRSVTTQQAVKVGDQICVWSDQSRVALAAVKDMDNRWHLEVTVWRDRVTS